MVKKAGKKVGQRLVDGDQKNVWLQGYKVAEEIKAGSATHYYILKIQGLPKAKNDVN